MHYAPCEATAPGDGNACTIVSLLFSSPTALLWWTSVDKRNLQPFLFMAFDTWKVPCPTQPLLNLVKGRIEVWFNPSTCRSLQVCKYVAIWRSHYLFATYTIVYWLSVICIHFISYHIIPILGAALCGQDAVPMRPIHNPALLAGGRGESKNLWSSLGESDFIQLPT